MSKENNSINFNHLKFFIEAAECTSLQEVADKMGYEVSTVSTNITNLENQLGVILFTRNPLKLTEVGKEIYDVSVKGFRDIEYVNVIARNNNDIDYGRISIGCPLHIINMYLLNKVDKAMKQHKNLKIELDCESSYPQMIKKIKNNKIQFALLDFIPELEYFKDLEVKKLYESQYIFVSKDEIKIKEAKDLEKYRYINNYDYRSSTLKLNELLKKYDVKIEKAISCTNEEIKVKAAKLRLGIAYVIKDTVKEDLKNHELYEVKVPFELPKTNINLVYMKNRLTKVDKKFIKDYLK